MYDSSDDVIELTADNFDARVLRSDAVWLVHFYASWSGHCRSLAPDWKKAAAALSGIVHVGAVDMDVHGSVAGPYNVRGFPTIKIFEASKSAPRDYSGARAAPALVDAALESVARVARERLGGRAAASGPSPADAGTAVVELTDANFESEVLGTGQPVLVTFFAPWNGHSQRLMPELDRASVELRGQSKLATLDATVHTNTAARFQVQGYPTIKVFRGGPKEYGSAAEYDGGRTASDIAAYMLELAAANVEPPEVVEITGDDVLEAGCNETPLGVIAFLPGLDGSNADARAHSLSWLHALGDEYKAKRWGWMWCEADRYPALEQCLGVAGASPTVVVVNVRKQVFVRHEGEFSMEGVDHLLRAIAVGRGRTERLANGLPRLD